MSEVFNPAVDNSGEPAVTDRVSVGSEMGNRILEFLYDKAALLDNLAIFFGRGSRSARTTR